MSSTVGHGKEKKKAYLLIDRKEGREEGRKGRKNSISEVNVSEKLSSAPGVDLSLFETGI